MVVDTARMQTCLQIADMVRAMALYPQQHRWVLQQADTVTRNQLRFLVRAYRAGVEEAAQNGDADDDAPPANVTPFRAGRRRAARRLYLWQRHTWSWRG